MTIVEIESVFAGALVLLPDKSNPQQEQRFRAIGTTVASRKAFIVFTLRRDLVRPISARYMHKEEVALYEKSYPDVRG